MALKKRTEIAQDTLEFDKYIHSNSDNFFTILNKENLKNGVQSSEINSALKEIKRIVIKTVREEIKFFLSLEEKLVSELNKKENTNFTRSSYLESLRDLHVLFNTDPSYDVFTLTEIKRTIASQKKPLDKYQKLIKEKILQPESFKKFSENERKKAKANKTKISEQEIKELYDAYIADLMKNIKINEKELEKELAEIEKELSSVHQVLLDNFLKLIEYVVGIYSPTTNKVTEPRYESFGTSAKKILDVAKSLGLKIDLDKELKKVLEEFKTELEAMGSIEFFREFRNMTAVIYFDKYVEAFQFATQLGNLFELALADSIIKVITEKSPLSILFLDAKSVKLEGTDAKITKSSPIDLTINEIKKDDGRKVSIGLSLKLKEDAAIKLENTNIENFIWKQKEILNINEGLYNYIRRNLKALNSFNNSNNSKILEELIKDFLIFEKEFVILTIMNRWLAGLFKKVGENQYQTVTPDQQDPFNRDLYTAFIFDTHDVYSVADILLGMLSIIESGPQQIGKFISGSFEGPFGTNPINEEIISPSMFIIKDRNKLKELYKAKSKAMMSLSEITYALILADSGVSSVIKSMETELDTLTYNKATLSLNVKNIKKIIGGL